MSIKIHHQNYETSDLPLAAALALWVPLERIDWDNPRRATFIFSNSEQLQELESKYHKAELRVEPRRYFDQLKAIKSRLYSQK